MDETTLFWRFPLDFREKKANRIMIRIYLIINR